MASWVRGPAWERAMAKWDVISAKKGPQKYDASHTEIYAYAHVHTPAADYGKNHFLIQSSMKPKEQIPSPKIICVLKITVRCK